MNALTLRTLSTFPAELQTQVRDHAYLCDLDELVQQVALAVLEARRGDTMRTIFNRARSAVRRFTQNPAHYGRDIEGIDDVAADDTRAAEGGKKQREIAREIAADHRVTTRRARQIIAAQLKRAKRGDLFADDGSDDGEKGEK